MSIKSIKHFKQYKQIYVILYIDILSKEFEL
jgi:hypothetical protein